MNIKSIIKEEIENNHEADIQQYIDIIDTEPRNPKYQRYVDVLKQKYGIEYIPPEERYKKEIELINVLNTINVLKRTTKGLIIRIISEKTKGLLTSLTLTAYHKELPIARMGFHINLLENSLRIGGVEVKPEFRREGVYTEMINIVSDIAIKNDLKIQEAGRSADAKNFWDNRNS